MLGRIKSLVNYAFRAYNSKRYINIDEVRAKVSFLLDEDRSTLERIGFMNGTDKSSLQVGKTKLYITHDYLRHYDFLFSSFRNDKITLLEFGCFRGDSLRMWEQYFPEAQIYGVDLDEGAKMHEKGRVHVVIGDATSQETHDHIRDTLGSAFIILDDASHAWGDQRRSFELFWDIVSPGGFYVIEDLECGTLGAYPAHPPKVLDSQPFCDYMHDISRILRWAPDRQPEVNAYHFEHLPERLKTIEREMDMCVFIPGAVIVRKKS